MFPFPLSNPVNDSFVNVGNISIWFESKQCSGDPANPSSIPTGYLSTQPVLSADGLAPTTGVIIRNFKCTALAYFDPESGNPNPTNQSTLDDYTVKFSLDYTNWMIYTFDFTFDGIAAVAPNGLIDTIEFKYNTKHNTTRIYTNQYDKQITQLGAYDYEDDCLNQDDSSKLNWDGSPYKFYYGPPAQCQGGSLVLSRYALILTDDRLVSKFIQQDQL